MKVEKNQIDALNLELTLTVEAADYAAISKKKFAECRRKADFKGFRKGMVPASMIQRVYGEQILVESVNEVVGTSLDNYINDEKLHILGEPLSSENQPEIEWKDGADFTFVFDVALAPEVNVEVTKEDAVPFYSVTVSDEDKAPMIENLKKYYSEKEETKTDEEIDEEVSARMADEFGREAQWRLSKDIRDFFVKKAGIELPEAFLKRWLLFANQGKFSKEDIDKEFAGFAEDFKWQMVRGKLMDKFGLKVEQKDVTDAAEEFVSYQYAMYGMNNLPAEILADAVKNVLSDSKQVDRLVEQVEDRKVISAIKEQITVEPKTVTAAEFREL